MNREDEDALEALAEDRQAEAQWASDRDANRAALDEENRRERAAESALEWLEKGQCR